MQKLVECRNYNKLHYNGLVYNEYLVNTDFSVPVECLLY